MGVTRCFYCKRTATTTAPLEKHHTFGRINSELTVAACKLCHEEITNEQQRSIPKHMREHSATPIERLFFAELSLSKHLEIMGRERARILKEYHSEQEHDDRLHTRIHQATRRKKAE